MGRQIPFTKVPLGALASIVPKEIHPILNAVDQLQDRLNEALRPLRQSPQQLVTAKGSIVAASGNGAPMEHKASSTDGLPLVTDSTQTTGLAYSALSLTSAVSGVLPIAKGGTNGTATPTNGGVTYGTGTAQAYSAAGTSGQLLQSAGAASPVWAGDTAWTAPTLGNGWVQFGAGSNQPVGYFKDASGFVHLRGAIKSGAGVAFTLAVGYRPATISVFPNYTDDQVSLVTMDKVNITAGGAVTPNAAGTGSTAFVSLDGITFDTR